MANQTAKIIPFPIAKKLLGDSQGGIKPNRTLQLLSTACVLMNLAVSAHEASDEVNLYDLIRTIHVTLGRLLAEGRQI